MIFFVRLLPLGMIFPTWFTPDIFVCLIVAWVMRQPKHLPVWLLAGVLLLDDVLFLRPPGLYALLVLLACEFLRSRNALTRDLNFLVEWALAAGLLLACLLADILLQIVFLVPQDSFFALFVMWLWTILCYPFLAGLGKMVLK